jgi:TolB-like protein/class 3 adenylate cyclase
LGQELPIQGVFSLAGERVQRRLAAVLAADVAGYSRLMGSDEEGTLDRLKAVRKALVDPTIAKHRGRIVKTTGDGMLVEFASAVDAVRGAVEVQRGMAEQNASVPQDKRIDFRIGIHVGDIIIDENDIFGDGVNVAARLEGIAEPGGVCMSNDAYRQVRGKVEIVCDDMGPQSLKNIAEPIQAWRVRLTGQTPSVGQSGSAANEPQALPLPDKPSIAVLPFQNMSGDPEQEYFADGMVEEIITAISRFKSLFVIARNSTFTYKGKAVAVKQVGRELGVRYVLDGSVRKAAGRVRITGQLIDAVSGTHLWADRFEGSLDDMFNVQDQVASAIAGVLDPTLLEAELARMKRKPLASLDAYDYFLRGSEQVYRWTNRGQEEGLRLLTKAIELDPSYGPAYALAAWCRCWRKDGRLTSDVDEERRTAQTLARQALRLGKDDAFCVGWAGYTLAVFAQNVDETREGAAHIDRALILNPNQALSWSLSGWVRVWLNDPEIAIEHQARGMRLSPLDPGFHFFETVTAYAHLRAARYDEAVCWAERAVRSHSRSAEAVFVLAASSALAGDFEKARSSVDRLLQLMPSRRVSNSPTVSRWPVERRREIADALRLAGLSD